MKQLRMHWKNDGTPAQPPVIPEGYAITAMPELENGIEQWLDMMQYGLSEKREDFSYYRSVMLEQPGYDEKKCFFVLHEGKAVATITVVCDPNQSTGLVHMVGSLPECRGKGIGNLLGEIAVYTLKQSGMKTCSLQTDDFRIPAIKTYLRAGFVPELSTQDYVQRWNAIYREIGINI